MNKLELKHELKHAVTVEYKMSANYQAPVEIGHNIAQQKGTSNPLATSPDPVLELNQQSG